MESQPDTIFEKINNCCRFWKSSVILGFKGKPSSHIAPLWRPNVYNIILKAPYQFLLFI